MSKLASLLVKITANGAQAERELKELSKKAEDFGEKMKNVGATMTKYVTGPLLALAAVSVKAANDQQQAEAKLLTALKGREDVQKRLIAQARKMQNRTLFSDEDIISQQAFLAALGLSEQQINDTMEAAIQLSAALGMELDAAVKNLAKTYGGLAGELGESIPALKELTAEQMKAGEAIKYVNENYKGFAETAADTGLGKLEQLKNKFMDLAAKLGEVLLPVLERLAEILIPVLESFTELSPAMQTTIVAVGGLVAALGPLLIVASQLVTAFTTISSVLPSMSAGLTGLPSVVGGLIGPLSVLAGFWGAVYSDIDNALDKTNADLDRQMEEKRKYYYQVYSDESISISDVARAMEAARLKMEEADKNFENNPASVYYLGEYKRAAGKWEGIQQAFNERYNAAADSVDSIGEAVNEMEQAAVGIIEKLQVRLSNAQERQKKAKNLGELASVNDEIARIEKEIADLRAFNTKDLNEMLDIREGKRVSMPLNGVSFGVSGPQATDLRMGVNNFSIASWAENMRAEAEIAAAKVEEVRDILNDSLSGLANELARFTTEMMESVITGEEFHPLQRFLELLGNTLKQLGTALITYATTMEAFKKAFSNPWVALAAGVAAIAAGAAFVALAKKPIKLAKGGLAYGPTLAVVGDNPGATNDPEVVAPLSKLRNFMGGQKLELVGDIAFELHGDTMRAVLDRNNVRLATLG